MRSTKRNRLAKEAAKEVAKPVVKKRKKRTFIKKKEED